MKKSVMGLMTCFNRKEKTIHAVERLIKGNPELQFYFMIVDAGSTDGTYEALAGFPEVHLERGDGSLFYSGGMRKAIELAKKQKEAFDYCLLFNDDVDFYDSAIEKLVEKEKSVIWVGPTCDEQGTLSYGGVIKKSAWRPKTEIVMGENASGKECDTFNANCVLIPWGIFKDLENIDDVYTHSMGDFDYGFSARKKGITIKVSDEYVGVCPDNPLQVSWRNSQLSRKERLRRKESPKGLPGKEWFHYLNKNYNLLTAILYSMIPYLRILVKK